jgi:3-oxoacyl-[acyl-carrier protein] reductase
MLSAIELIRQTIDGMIERRFGRIVSITSHMVKAPVGMLGLSNGARSGLTGFVGGVARDVAQYGVTLNNVLPGQFDTDRLKSNHLTFAAARNVELEEARAQFMRQIPARRFGEPREFGAACAFLCSAHAGFITGQNLLLDGGQFPGLL